MASNTQGGLGAMFSGMADGYMAGSSLQRTMADRQKADEDEIAQRQREQDQQRRTEAERHQMQLQQLEQQQPSQQGMGLGMDPSTMASMGSMFGSTGGQAGGAAAGSTTGTASSGGVAGGSAAGGSSSLAGGAAAAGPWAALAAIIAVNEKSARNGGHRADGWQYGKDLLGGKVLEQDTNGRWSQKLGGYDDDKTGLLNDAGAGAEFSTLDFSNGFKKLKNGTTGKVIDAVKKLF